MKRSILTLTTIASVCLMVLPGCNKNKVTDTSSPKKYNTKRDASDYSSLGLYLNFTNYSISGNTDISNILSTNFVSNTLSNENFTVNSSGYYTKVLDTPTGKFNYIVDLQTGTQSTSASLVITPLSVSRKIYMVALIKAITSGGVTTTTVKSVGGTYFDPSELRPGTKEWRDCMVAAWNDVTNDASGTIACALAPGPCLAACAISCTFMTISVPGCVDDPNMSDAQAITCLCNLGLLDCSKMTYEGSYSFGDPF